MEINVGDYIRCGTAGIRQVKSINKRLTDLSVQSVIDDRNMIMDVKYIYNCSPEYKNLLEPYDIVNGFTIEEFDDDEGNTYLGIPIYDDAMMNCIVEVRPIDSIEIKEILTHEQYDSRCFKVNKN